MLLSILSFSQVYMEGDKSQMQPEIAESEQKKHNVDFIRSRNDIFRDLQEDENHRARYE
jgi:hypothetical protein